MAGQKKQVGAGKGDRRRVAQISEKELEEKWNRIFKKKKVDGK